MDNRIGWKFPLTGGGTSDGFNDPSMAHFEGDRSASLARETIQNSLDAGNDNGEPVLVSFELVKIDDGSVFGKSELIETLNACMKSEDCKEADQAELEQAIKALETKSVSCLKISDRNTTGLRGKLWRALVKARGLVEKSDEGAGGSYGIGKAAPFAVTPLRAVFYWTHYKENGNSVEKLQGKAVLMSHDSGDGETQGTGYYGVKDECKELELTKEIQKRRKFRVLDQGGKPVEGTALNILGFSAEDNWRMRIAESVIANYFYAIDHKKLEICIEPDEAMEKHDLLTIDAESIEQWLKHLKDQDADSSGREAVEDARALRRANKGGVLVEKQDKDLGHCRLWILVGDDLPSKVGFVRKTGMLITTRQSGLIQFRNFRNFAALCYFDASKGNELLRRMENPQHDQFEPDRISDEKEKDLGRRALKRITTWIRDEIKKQAGPPEGGTQAALTELSSYLPYHDPEEAFDSQSGEDDGANEAAFDGKITLERTRRTVQSKLQVVIDDKNGDGGEDGEDGGRADTGNQGQGGNSISDGPGEGEGEGGSGNRGGGTSSANDIPISRVRIVPIPNQDNCYRISFIAEKSGMAHLSLREAGDYAAEKRQDIRSINQSKPLERIVLKSGERAAIEITADRPVGGRSLVLVAKKVSEESS